MPQKQYPQEEINFKIVSAKIDMANFKDEVDVVSKLIKEAVQRYCQCNAKADINPAASNTPTRAPSMAL